MNDIYIAHDDLPEEILEAISNKIRDRKYLDSFKCSKCVICLQDCVGHHLRYQTGAGTSLKASDNLTIPLCHEHHAEVHRIGDHKFFNKYNESLLDIDPRFFAYSLWLIYKKDHK